MLTGVRLKSMYDSIAVIPISGEAYLLWSVNKIPDSRKLTTEEWDYAIANPDKLNNLVERKQECL